MIVVVKCRCSYFGISPEDTDVHYAVHLLLKIFSHAVHFKGLFKAQDVVANVEG